MNNKMNKLLVALFCLLIASCSSADEKNSSSKEGGKGDQETPLIDDTIPKVTGIGGIFFYSDNPKETNEWYTKNLGIEINEWGSSSFESRNVDRPDEINSLQWKSFKNGDEYFAPSTKDFMINYQVRKIEELVTRLTENGVTILDSLATFEYGKFIHVLDNEGNKIELWEPN
jgi:predicted enzyme related to lactoylglutathione lyase